MITARNSYILIINDGEEIMSKPFGDDCYIKLFYKNEYFSIEKVNDWRKYDYDEREIIYQCGDLIQAINKFQTYLN